MPARPRLLRLLRLATSSVTATAIDVATLLSLTTLLSMAAGLAAVAASLLGGLTVAEVPVQWSDDRRSRIRPLADAWAITREFLEIRRLIARRFAGSPPGAGPRGGPARRAGAGVRRAPPPAPVLVRF